MRPRRTHLFALGAVLHLLTTAASGQEAQRPDPAPIAADKLREHVSFLASDELAGRDSGEPGLEVAAEYIANRLRELGLEPAGDHGTYFQSFTVPFGADFGRVIGAVISGEKAGERKLEPIVDVVPFGYGEQGMGPVDAPVVFAGYGITASDEDRKNGLDYDDYSGLDVKGKAVIVLRFVPRLGWEDRPAGERRGVAPERTFGGRRSPHAPLVSKIRNARDHGAAAVILVTPRGSASPGGEGDLEGIAHRAAPRRPTLPSLVASTESVAEILRAAGKDLEGTAREIDEALAPRSFELPGVRVRLDTTPGHRVLRNVAASLPGRGDLAGEAVVIGAHYDHIGRFGNQVDSKNLGRIHNGADDNASGTAGVLELARVFSKEKERAGRRLIFLCFSGEEIGLLGSRAWLEARPRSAPPIAAMVNLDMIGRAKDGSPVTILGADSSREFPPLLESLSKKLGVAAQWSGKGAFGGGSDHASFLNRSIPVLFFFTGMHAEYNTPNDDAPTLNYDGERAILELVRAAVEAIATAPARPVFEASALAAARGGHGKPKLGVQIESEADGGARVRRVEQDSPAARSGVKEGDVILGLGDVAVRGAEELIAAVEAAPQGEEIPLKVRRNEGDLTLKVLFPAPRGGFRVVFGSVPDYGFAEKGVRFEGIRPGTPAEKAGARAGDVLVRWNGKDVEDVEQWTALLGAHKPGDEVTATVRRGRETIDLKVKLTARE